MITAKVQLTQPLRAVRQLAATTGSEHHMLVDDAAGDTGPKPIELVAVGLAGCTQVFTAVRIHHVVTGYEIDVAALEEAIRLSEEKYCSVGAMVRKSASFHTTYEILEDKTEWMKAVQAPGVQS